MDRKKLQTFGSVALVGGVAAFLLAVLDEPSASEDGFTQALRAIFLIVGAMVAFVGVVMLALSFFADDSERTTPEGVWVENRTREIMEAEGIKWRQAFARASAEPVPDPPLDVEAATRAASSAATGTDIEGRLRELKRLHDQGLIETDEYRRKRQSLIEQL